MIYSRTKTTLLDQSDETFNNFELTQSKAQQSLASEIESLPKVRENIVFIDALRQLHIDIVEDMKNPEKISLKKNYPLAVANETTQLIRDLKNDHYTVSQKADRLREYRNNCEKQIPLGKKILRSVFQVIGAAIGSVIGLAIGACMGAGVGSVLSVVLTGTPISFGPVVFGLGGAIGGAAFFGWKGYHLGKQVGNHPFFMPKSIISANHFADQVVQHRRRN